MTKLTLLNSMAGTDFTTSLDTHIEWGLSVLDLKDSIFGKNLIQLTNEEAKHAADLIQDRKLSVYCFSTVLFHEDIEMGEAEFRKRSIDNVDRIIQLAHILKPQVIRLLGARTSKRTEFKNSIQHINTNHPWLIPLYAEAIDKIYNAGFKSTIENETGDCIFSTPEEIVDFYTQLNRKEKVTFTWDVQNLWQAGTFPTVDVYQKIKDLIGYYHVKGGQHNDESTNLCWSSSLEDASWPVIEITKQVVSDGVSPVICLNPSHGKPKDGYDYTNVTKRNIDFLRKEVPGIE